MTDDRPIGGGGGYNINWDEIDENTNPFGLGNAFGGSKIASSPPAGKAPKVQNDPPPESDPLPPPTSEDPPLNSAANGGSGDVPPEPQANDSGNSKPAPKKIKSPAKGPRPAPPKRTVSKNNSAEDKDEIAANGKWHYLFRYFLASKSGS